MLPQSLSTFDEPVLSTFDFAQCKLCRRRYFVRLVIGIISFYQKVISPLKGSCCRFYPSCSAYAKQVIKKQGLRRGGLLAVRRLIRCHPFNPGGYDPVE